MAIDSLGLLKRDLGLMVYCSAVDLIRHLLRSLIRRLT